MDVPRYFTGVKYLDWFEITKLYWYLKLKGMEDPDVDARIKEFQSHRHVTEYKHMEQQYRCVDCGYWSPKSNEICYGYNHRGKWK